MRRLLEALGDPQRGLRVVHVAGTNGKGSVCAMLDSVLTAQGLRVGRFTSPHLQHVNERIRVGGRPISDEDLGALLTEVDQAAQDWGADLPEGGSPPTYFELLTVAALVHFARQDLDICVIEVGLGGRLDATNVVSPMVCAVTSISLDHTDRLGHDLSAIAFEKAGIIKPEVPVVVGRLPRAASSVIRSAAMDRRAPASFLGEAHDVEGDHEDFAWCGRRSFEGLRLSLPGQHQVDNAGVALAVLEELGNQGVEIGEPAIRAGLATARHAARLEWLDQDLLLDGAHNPAGAEALADYLASLPRDRPRTLLLGASDDKDIRGLASALVAQVDRVYTTRCAHFRAREPGAVARELVDLGLPVLPVGPIEEALPIARDGSLVVVAGSLFLAGAVRDLVA